MGVGPFGATSRPRVVNAGLFIEDRLFRPHMTRRRVQVVRRRVISASHRTKTAELWHICAWKRECTLSQSEGMRAATLGNRREFDR